MTDKAEKVDCEVLRDENIDVTADIRFDKEDLVGLERGKYIRLHRAARNEMQRQVEKLQDDIEEAQAAFTAQLEEDCADLLEEAIIPLAEKIVKATGDVFTPERRKDFFKAIREHHNYSVHETDEVRVGASHQLKNEHGDTTVSFSRTAYGPRSKELKKLGKQVDKLTAEIAEAKDKLAKLNVALSPTEIEFFEGMVRERIAQNLCSRSGEKGKALLAALDMTDELKLLEG